MQEGLAGSALDGKEDVQDLVAKWTSQSSATAFPNGASDSPDAGHAAHARPDKGGTTQGLTWWHVASGLACRPERRVWGKLLNASDVQVQDLVLQMVKDNLTSAGFGGGHREYKKDAMIYNRTCPCAYLVHITR